MSFRSLLLPLLLVCSSAALAQTHDFGTELEASYGFKPWKGGEITVGEELRFKDNSRRYAKSETGLSLQQGLLRKPLKQYDMRWRVGGGYSFINRQSASYRFSNQHRFYVQTSLSKDLSRLRLGFRTRLQTTQRNPETGDYRDNPQTYLRLRLSASYDFKGTPWQVELSHEGFLRTFSPTGSEFDEMRTILSATYDMGKHHSLTLYGKRSQELQTSNPETFYCLGLSYQFQ